MPRFTVNLVAHYTAEVEAETADDAYGMAIEEASASGAEWEGDGFRESDYITNHDEED